jgi:hypothetical protein
MPEAPEYCNISYNLNIYHRDVSPVRLHDILKRVAERRPQTYQNYTRLDPAFHFFLAPFAFVTFVASVWHAIKHPDLVSLWLTLGALLFVVEVFLNRIYSLKVQDRVIRLEERLRLTTLLPDSQRTRIGELTERQLIALRFASDAELPALAAKAIDERMAPADIKKAIRSWRPDYFRV